MPIDRPAQRHVTPGRPLQPGAVPLPRGVGESPWAVALRWLLRLGTALGLALALGFLPYRLYLRSGLSRYLELQGQLDHLQLENQGLRRENRRLMTELDRLKEDDDRAIERVARDELGLIRPGELVYKVELEGPR